MKKKRADALLVERGRAENKKQAMALIMTGKVMASDESGREQRVEKAGDLLDPSTTFRLAGEKKPFASRAGEKLHAAVERFGVDVRGMTCIDIGQSTGGFTDCLLFCGARRVHGVDVGYGQLHWRLRNDPRVVLHERTNARTLEDGAFGEPIQLAVIDVSFISLTAVLPAITRQLDEDGQIIALVKPQFEAPKEAVVGGIVVDPSARNGAIDKVVSFAETTLALSLLHQMDSTVAGRDGNVEHLVHFEKRRSGGNTD